MYIFGQSLTGRFGFFPCTESGVSGREGLPLHLRLFTFQRRKSDEQVSGLLSYVI